MAMPVKPLFSDWTVEKPATARKKAARAEQERLRKELEAQEREDLEIDSDEEDLEESST